ncbi:pectinesterase 2-like [Actinidia eriantha]|uniref:pectinesterase 2-like n=1 Tax=Actinidia eriantha TaxID=165200 RepID=UPI002590E687|nr:pectinesterase 2-like [Actinidia eriantha]
MDRTVISGNKSHGGGFQTNETPTVGIKSSGFIAQNITFRNTAGPENDQAVALSIEADRAAFYKCRFQAYQDTLYTRGISQFFRDCEIYGTIDFIFGDATVVFQNCIIYAQKPLEFQKNTITAQKRELQRQISGTIIQNCTITAADDLRQQKSKFKTFLGRPWGNYSTTIIMQSFLDDIIDPLGWLEWEGRGVDKVYYVEYKNRGPGANTEGRVKWARVINSSTTAAKFSVRNFIEGDKWIPSTGIPFFLDLL